MGEIKERYKKQLMSLLPSGAAWPQAEDTNLSILMDLMAGELERVQKRLDQLIEEVDPRTAFEMLSDWERVLALPDPCDNNVNDTLQERRSRVVQKLTTIGAQDRSYFNNLANILGYQITIEEYRAIEAGNFECGVSVIEEPDGNLLVGCMPDSNYPFYWNVLIAGDRVTRFECGVSEIGKDYLANIDTASDLECIFHKYKPAHTHLTFIYQ